MSSEHPIYLEAVNTFREKFARLNELGMREPSAVTVATVGEDGMPSARIVLLRGHDERGFVFFTNSLSRKGTQLREHGRAALAFYWDKWAEQCHVEGTVEKLADDESDAYWMKRPRGSQIGAWASLQSQPLSSREELLARYEKFEVKFDGQDVPRPDHWYGFRVVPRRIEFWCGRDARLHERFVYKQSGEDWTKQMLYP
ncbi:MAG: pyridoxamine 5'-phosphate oxidase [Planctomycetota bacterium]|nr:pyridoxamine 5'-phosphate oxidase [Planctomycetota bacterium]MDA1250879.1 pyridoxamine 5'-phosphate oxidase [Planctomycetota bacterium]